MSLYALVDCNSCYASCEAIFRPDLRDKPIVVLSNNDGCIVARNQAAKALGIPDLQPYFKIKRLLHEHGVHVFSSNYELYGDISNRIMDILNDYTPELEVYSIDEAFLLLNFPIDDVKRYAQKIRAVIWQQIRMPVSVGVAPTKTLAKLANRAAKDYTRSEGVCVLDTPEKWQWLQERSPVHRLWGVGRRLARRMRYLEIETAWDLAQQTPKYIRKYFNVNVERTLRELNGEACIEIDNQPTPKKQIFCSRSFSQHVTTCHELEQAVSLYAFRAAEKLRQQNSFAKEIYVFINTSRFAKKRYSKGLALQLPYPSDDTRLISKIAREGVKRLYRPGYNYAKAGVGLIDITDKHYLQMPLFDDGQPKKDSQLMALIDRINCHSKGTLFFANQGIKPEWILSRDFKSPAYTTRWPDLPTIKI